MAEVIDFLERTQQLKKQYEDEETDIDDAKLISKDIFYETLMTLEELGYSPNENPQTLKDLEALSFIATAVIFRIHKNYHPGLDLLDIGYKHLLDTISFVEETLNAENDNKV